MIPVLTAEEMKAVDQAAPEPVEVLIERAGAAVAAAALRMLGGTYGRRVTVVAGKGNNGADGRAAARRLAARGVRVEIVDGADPPGRLPAADLVIDAAYGTGFRGTYRPPDPGDAPVLAVDVPSGNVVRAAETVTFAALKPALLLGDGPEMAGRISVADIGLDVGQSQMHLVETADVSAALPPRPRESHKWQTAVFVAAGSPGMLGAPMLVSRAAMRAGSGYARLGIPGQATIPPSEVVAVALPAIRWDEAVLPELDRCKALVVGPGLGTADVTVDAVRRLVPASPVPTVVDADGLNGLGRDAAKILADRPAATVLTPHAAEFERLTGEKPEADPVRQVRALASDANAVVLLKGSTTVVAAPDGRVLFVASGSPVLATAGTGDVLSGMIGAFLAQGLPPFEAAAFAAHAHGCAARDGFQRGLVAGDIPELLAGWLSELAGE